MSALTSIIRLLLKGRQRLRDVLRGRLLSHWPFTTQSAAVREAMLRAIRRSRFSPNSKLPMPRDPGGGHPPDAGQPAWLRPVPGHHLVAAKALPPSDRTYLLPKD